MRIALIAMSGVRAFSEELTRIGMTLPGFAERGRTVASLPSLSLLTLAGMTPDRIDLSYHEIADLRELGELPPCDLAAVSTMTAQVKDAYDLAKRYRDAGTRTALGGLHATALPDEALRHFDTVVVGEGELSWPSLLEDFEARRLRCLYDPHGQEFNLDDAPMPRFELLDPEKYNRLTVQTQRGCPWRCEFCASSILLTHRYKLKPVAKVIGEIRAIKAVWPRPFIEFADDNTFVNKRRSKELLRALASERVRWFTETDISVADDLELLSLMRESGCAQVLVGLESPTAAALDGIELNRNWKRDKFDRYKEAIKRIQSHGILVTGCFVLGLDGHTPAVFEDVHRFVEESGVGEVQITVMTPFPGTPLYERLRTGGRLLNDTAWEKCTLFDVNVRPDGMSVSELERGLLELGHRLYTTEAKKARVGAFKRQYRERWQSTAAGGD
jgi:radical SAM superfamily enzyme YgiQ (UPF0313 family)